MHCLAIGSNREVCNLECAGTICMIHAARLVKKGSIELKGGGRMEYNQNKKNPLCLLNDPAGKVRFCVPGMAFAVNQEEREAEQKTN